MKLFSPAKVNLFLRVLSRRPDGYHEIASLFQAIDLGDTLFFSLGKRDILTCTTPHVPCDPSNLILQAANLFRAKTGLSFGLRIHLDKQIPLGAGLAGGSSNAATTLWALNALHNHPATSEELAQWSSEIGSDIPFFFSQGTAYITGRGEHVLSLPPLANKGWLVQPSYAISTPHVFRQLDLSKCSPLKPNTLLQGFFKGSPTYTNDLELPAFTLHPSLQKAKTRLTESGFQTVMTGSGSTLIAFGDKVPPKLQGMQSRPFCFLARQPSTWFFP